MNPASRSPGRKPELSTRDEGPDGEPPVGHQGAGRGEAAAFQERRRVQHFRAEAGPRLGEFSSLVNRLLEASAAFRAGWEGHGVEGFTSPTTPTCTSSSTPRSGRPTPPLAWHACSVDSRTSPQHHRAELVASSGRCSYRGGVGAFAEMFPGGKPELPARDEDQNGDDPPFRFPDGPLDLVSGVVRIERRRTADQADPADD